MPPATGFQYTPPSYLLRAGDTTNRPWTKTEEGEAHTDDTEYTGDNEYDLPQEQRPQTRRESHLDAHFQQRVRNKQRRYRDILKGDAEIESDSNLRNRPLQNQHGKDGSNLDGRGCPYANATLNANSNSNGEEVDDDEDSILLAAKNADSYADVHSARIHAQSSKSNQTARRNRKERITGFADASTARKSALSSASASDAETARTLRAQRLRLSLLKQTPDEYDVQTKLELRRLARKEEEAFARKSGRESGDGNGNGNSNTMNNTSLNTSKAQERMAMEAERKVLQEEREALAIAKEEAALALMRAAELNEERIRQRELDARLEEERLTKRRDRAKEDARSKQQQKEQQQQNSYYSTSKKNKNRKLKTKNFVSGSASTNTNTDGDTLMTEFDAENDFAFLSDLSGIVRDTGFLKSCGACFGDAEVVEDVDEKEMVLFTGASSNISSVFVPDLAPSSDHSASDDDRTTDSIRRSRVYAKYRA